MQQLDPAGMAPQDIQAALDHDRAELTRTIEQLRERLSAEALTNDAIAIAGNALAPLGEALDRAVRANPVAAAVAGAGLVWLLLGSRTDRAAVNAPPGLKSEALPRWEDDGGPPALLPDNETDWIGEADRLRRHATADLKLVDATARARRRGSARSADVLARELAQDRAEVLADLARDTRAAMLSGLDDQTVEARRRILSVREAAYGARLTAVRGGGRLMADNPMVAAAMAALIGVAVGSALPRTDAEDRLFSADSDGGANGVF